MGKQLSAIDEQLKKFIQSQKIFFVGTAAENGRVNISPKGIDSLRVTGENQIVWLNLTGSGNETAAHLLKNNRMTIMFCAFEGKPMILRLYGKAHIYHPRDSAFHKHISHFSNTEGARQIIEMQVDLVQTSCGFAVPLMEYQEDRTILKDWAINKGEEKIKEYWQQKNTRSIDDFETNILPPESQ